MLCFVSIREIRGLPFSLKDGAEIVAVARFAKFFNRFFKAGLIEKAHLETDFLQAGDAQTLAVLDDADKFGRLEQ